MSEQPENLDALIDFIVESIVREIRAEETDPEPVAGNECSEEDRVPA